MSGNPQILELVETALDSWLSVGGVGHGHVVQVHDFGDGNGRPYFTMELIEGGHLGEKLRGVPQSAKESAAFLIPLAGAVHAAHSAGIVHRDLKPSNILLTGDG